jgi:hypothetical protein
VIWVDHPLHCSCVECVARDSRYAGKRGTARSLIERLSRRGVSFRLVGAKVRYRPAERLSDEERREIRRVRDEVYQLLRKDDDRRRRGEGMFATRARSSRWRGAPSSRAGREQRKAGG